ncbi:hypothetical protein ACJRO7_010018 [Eucalyptus globulus]|uniref:Uncharacterized protein n=1 Tax=Eucalyptus globulus TaxID=34317 RepID=A0ABD3LAM7_EUCGL
MAERSDRSLSEDENRMNPGSEETEKKGGSQSRSWEDESNGPSVERIFEGQGVPSWRRQLTFRAFAVSFALSVMLAFMKLNLTTGINPSLNVSAGLLGFFFVKTWTKVLEKFGLLRVPFTWQENTVIQTCVVASSGITFSGGFGGYLFAMSERVANQSTDPQSAYVYKNPSLPWMIGYLFVVSFLGLFAVVPLRKIMIIDFKLMYPSGTATAHLINSFHTPEGAKLAKKEVKALGKFFSFSFLWGFFQWFYRAEDDCGFARFPTLGLKALQYRFYFDFSATHVGVGMICPYITNISVLLGGILSWGLMWPLIETRKGQWYPADVSDTSMRGLQGYKVFIAIALVLGDGIYNFLKVLGRTLPGMYHQLRDEESHVLPIANGSPPDNHQTSYDDQRRTQLFLKDKIPTWFAVAGYITIATISIAILPYMFPQLKRYHILAIYLFAPTLGFCNAYGSGLTDWSLASAYGKLAIFVIGAWADASNGGILASLAACGVITNIVSTASDLTQDFKTGYLTLASPRSVFVSQVIGTAMGCVISPCVFWLFYKGFKDLEPPGKEYVVPYGIVYRSMAELGVEGFASLPKHCLTLCCGFLVAAMIINGFRDLVGKKWARFIPLPMAMAIPFYIGPSFAIDMCVGSLILFIWEKTDKAKADAFGPAVASGLICGDGLWTLPSSILALAGVNPPICMKFLSLATNKRR